MDRHKLALYFNTAKFLTPGQIIFRVYYLLRNRLTRRERANLGNDRARAILPFSGNSPKGGELYVDVGALEFTFLNKKVKFQNKVDWNYGELGKLWTYNLNYFEYLNRLPKDDGLLLIRSFMSYESEIRAGFEPYPISLRAINWIKFISRHGINDEEIDSFLYSDYRWLVKNLEYHILGNHLLENAFSLLIGAYYFRDRSLFNKAKKLILAELDEQILSDGAHFELSPMYHSILFHRVLDCYDIARANRQSGSDDLAIFLKGKAVLMTSWLRNICFSNGTYPHLNDSTDGIAPTANELLEYAEKLGIEPNSQLHAHADTFSFALCYKGMPIIVDLGISTYEAGGKRSWERSTNAHNTLEINYIDSSRVWGAFRVANRAAVAITHESQDEVAACHNGYRYLSVEHCRTFKRTEETFDIEDAVKALDEKKIQAVGHLHFAPEAHLTVDGQMVVVNHLIQICFGQGVSLDLEDYSYSLGFNKTTIAKRLVYKSCSLHSVFSIRVQQ